MCYDNSELLKNYVHAYQVTGTEFFANVARDIIRWMDEWLSDRERGGFYASQDADYSMDDDGDYFTWTRAEMQAVLTEAEAGVVGLHYDVNEVGEMHHNPEKNVLYVRAPVGEIAKRMGLTVENGSGAPRIGEAENVCRPPEAAHALCRQNDVYGMELALRLRLPGSRESTGACTRPPVCAALIGSHPRPRPGSRSRDLQHVIAYSDPAAERRVVPGLLDDYAFTAIACLDAYESTADLSYFNFAQRITDKMVALMFDPVSGGFFDTPHPGNGDKKPMGVLGTRRKPFQDSPTPAGNSAAAIALLRLHSYSNQPGYRDKAEQTLEVLAGLAGKFGIFAATYGIAAVYFSHSHTQIVILGDDDLAEQFHTVAASFFGLGKSVIKLAANEAVAQNLPPGLGETIPHLSGVTKGKSAAVLCSGFSCQPPIFDPEELRRSLARSLKV